MQRFVPLVGITIAITLAATAMLALATTEYFKLREERRLIEVRHTALVQTIVEAAQGLAVDDVSSAIAVRFGAKDVRAVPLMMVSNPPKVELTFILDGVRHSTTYLPRLPVAKPRRVGEGQ